jgi:protein ImuB
MFAVFHLPQFSLQAILRHAMEDWAKPVALVDPGATTPRVCDLTHAAREQGVELGSTPTQALARCRAISLRHRAPAQETALTDALLQCAYHFSPHVENTAPGLVTLDLRGLAELSEVSRAAAGESNTEARRAADPLGAAVPVPPTGAAPAKSPALLNWLGRLQTALAGLQVRTGVGVGPTPNIARHAALWLEASRDTSTAHIVTDATAFIAALPVAALDPSSDVAGILQKWGVRTVGQLMALGQEAVMDRLGLEAIALFAAASAQTMRPLHLVRPAEVYEETYEFEHAVETAEPLLFLLNRFVGQLSHRLGLGGMAAGRLILQLRLETGERLDRTLSVPQPTHRPDVLFRMLQTHLENLRTDSPIVGLALRADPTRPEQKQFSLFEAALRDPQQFQETLARLSALVGPGRVGSPVRENSHRPDAFQLVPPDFENTPVLDGPSCDGLSSRPTPELLRPTPMRRLRPPVSAVVETTLTAETPGPRATPSPRATRSRTGAVEPSQSARPNIVELLGPLFSRPSPANATGAFAPPNGAADAPADDLSRSPEAGAPLRENASAPPPSLPDRPLEETETAAPPIAVRCAVARGKLTIALGPWRASGHWWEPGAWQREEWDVQTREGQALRLAYSHGAWRVEAVLD